LIIPNREDLVSKKKRRQQKKGLPTPMIVLIIGGFLLLAAVVFYVFSNNDTSGGTPTLAVDQQKIDYGDQKFNTKLTFAIKVTNIGDGSLRFKEKPYIEVLEGC
jgi:hypothetical protein